MLVKAIEYSGFKVDGQAMFGSTDKKEWQRLYPSDENNLCQWALRSLIVDDGKHIVLIDSGFGDGDNQLLKDYCVENFQPLYEVILDSGFNCDQVTHLIQTHLHIDHCGGSYRYDNSGTLIPTFKNAQYLLSSQQLNDANNPSNFEKESFQPEIISAVTTNFSLKLVDEECFVFPWLELFFFYGHTNGLIIPVIHSPKHSIVFAGDLIPSAAHLLLQSTMSYDVNQILSLAERENFLEEATKMSTFCFFSTTCTMNVVRLKKKTAGLCRLSFLKYLN